MRVVKMEAAYIMSFIGHGVGFGQVKQMLWLMMGWFSAQP